MTQKALDGRLRRIALAIFLWVLAMAPARAAQVEVNNPGMTVPKDADTVELVYTVINTGVASNMAVTIGHPTEFIKPFFDGPTNDTKNHVLSIGPIDSMCGTLAVKGSCTVDAFFDVLDGDPFNKVNPAHDGVWLAVLSVPWTTSDGLLSGTGFGLGGVRISVTLAGGAIAGIPEPSTWAMLLLGFGGIGFTAWRRVASAKAVAIGPTGSFAKSRSRDLSPRPRSGGPGFPATAPSAWFREGLLWELALAAAAASGSCHSRSRNRRQRG